jgi:hypothetical protein
MTTKEALDYLRVFLMMSDFYNEYPSKRFVLKDFDRTDIDDERKLELIVGDSAVQKLLYGDVLSSIDMYADPVKYFYEHMPFSSK